MKNTGGRKFEMAQVISTIKILHKVILRHNKYKGNEAVII